MTDRTPDYGIDAPGLVRFFLLGGSVGIASAAAAYWLIAPDRWAALSATILTLIAAYLLGMGCLMICWSRIVKLRDRDRLLDAIAWRGDETVLDVGCGRGLMLIGAALRLPGGHATGIDIWQESDQSANSAEATLRNAQIERVANRITVETADMRSLPFADGTFDVIVSHWAVHNLPSAAARDTALAEMMRVLKDDGAILLADIAHLDDYARTFVVLGLTDQRHVGSVARAALLGLISFGSFRPTALILRRSR